MKTKIAIVLTLFAFAISSVSTFATNFKYNGFKNPGHHYIPRHRFPGGKYFPLKLVGTDGMYESTVPDIDGDNIDDPAFCFDIEVVDMRTDRVIGPATDCLSNFEAVGDGLALIGTTYFHLPQGTVITRAHGTVQPVTQPIVTPGGQVVSHVTGASTIENSIIGGTGYFFGKTGTVRLSGLVNMANFTGSLDDPIAFDCIFIIDLD